MRGRPIRAARIFFESFAAEWDSIRVEDVLKRDAFNNPNADKVGEFRHVIILSQKTKIPKAFFCERQSVNKNSYSEEKPDELGFHFIAFAYLLWLYREASK
jgi:hypothetical protein